MEHYGEIRILDFRFQKKDPCGNSSTRGKNSHWYYEVGPKYTAFDSTELVINALN